MRWHRDIGQGDPAPLHGMISNMEHHGPSYLQWNIALYDDNVLWIVPGRRHRHWSRIIVFCVEMALLANRLHRIASGVFGSFYRRFCYFWNIPAIRTYRLI